MIAVAIAMTCKIIYLYNIHLMKTRICALNILWKRFRQISLLKPKDSEQFDNIELIETSIFFILGFCARIHNGPLSFILHCFPPFEPFVFILSRALEY